MKKIKSPVKHTVANNLKSYSLEDIIREEWGRQGSVKRTKAEERIKTISENLIINNTLKEIREKHKKSQADIASIMEVDHSVVSKIEKNFHAAQLNTILRYAKALSVKKVKIVFEFGKNDAQVLNLDFKEIE